MLFPLHVHRSPRQRAARFAHRITHPRHKAPPRRAIVGGSAVAATGIAAGAAIARRRHAHHATAAPQSGW